MDNNKKRTCKMCGIELAVRYTKTGKYEGYAYYTMFCETCRIQNRKRCSIKKGATKNRSEDRQRKRWFRTCEVCLKEFLVNANTNHKKVKSCSAECKGEIIRRENIARNSVSVLKDIDKGWSKMFEEPQTKEKTKLGPTHHRSKEVKFISPCGKVYSVKNITNFVREHEYLFFQNDVVWKSNRISKTQKRHSTATGCLRCNASAGLIQVASERKSSWKNWRKVNAEELNHE